LTTAFPHLNKFPLKQNPKGPLSHLSVRVADNLIRLELERQPKVADAGRHVRLDEHILGLEVPVGDGGLDADAAVPAGRVVDPKLDPDSVALWIRIRIGDPDPGSRGKKMKKF
jgi:hypothetical protein